MRLTRWLSGMTHCAGVITLTSAGRAHPTSPPGLSPFYPFISILRTMQSATPGERVCLWVFLTAPFPRPVKFIPC